MSAQFENHFIENTNYQKTTMAKYKWNFVSVGGSTRVRITCGEDIRHLNELDPKMWTVLSCPTTGLELEERSLKLMDAGADGMLHMDDVIAVSQWLGAKLKDLDSLLEHTDTIKVANILDTAIVPEDFAGKEEVSLADVEAAIAAVTITEQPVPAAPLEADVIAAYKAKKDEYAAYYEQEKLQKLGLAVIPEETAKPGMKEKEFIAMGEQIAAYEAAVAAANDANAAALAAGQAKYQELLKLLLIHRDFYTLLCNFVTLSDFYDRHKWAIFQAGTLIIDQRACHLCVRVNDMGKQTTQAGASGMFLLFCDCVNKKLDKTMSIVAAVTVGEIKNLTVGKNAIFYDRQGNDWDAVVTKVIDNPISIQQAFWSPYRKFGQWVTGLINKSAAEKNDKAFADMTAKAQANVENVGKTEKESIKMQAFDIAKFAGIFAAIGMAIGFIGDFLVKLASGINDMPKWQLLVWIAGIILVISGPAMILAAIKLHRRNLAPILNANGWAINAEAIVNVLFGATLTEQVQFPIIKMQDPFKPKMSKGRKWCIAALAVAIVIALLVMVWLATQDGHCPIELFCK